MWRGFLPLQRHWSSVHYCHMACLSWPPTVRILEVIRNYWQRGSCVGGASVLWRKCPYCVSSAYVLSFENVCSTRSIPGAFYRQHPYSLMAGYIISAVTSVCHTSDVHTWSSLNNSIHCLSAEDRCSCKWWCVETATRWCWLRTDVARRTGNKRRKLCMWPGVIRMQDRIGPQRLLTLHKSLENVADFE